MMFVMLRLFSLMTSTYRINLHLGLEKSTISVDKTSRNRLNINNPQRKMPRKEKCQAGNVATADGKAGGGRKEVCGEGGGNGGDHGPASDPPIPSPTRTKSNLGSVSCSEHP